MGGEHVVRIKCKKDPNFIISYDPVRGVILMPLIEDDLNQIWVIDDSWRDEGAFALVHKSSGKALQAALPHQQVNVMDYDPTKFDPSFFWKWRYGDDGGYGSIQSCKFEFLFLDVCAEKVETDSQILLWEWSNKPHKFWKFQYVDVVYTIRSRIDSQFALTAMPVEDGTSITMAALEENDPCQQWKLEAQSNQTFLLHNIAHNLFLKKRETDNSLALGNADPLHLSSWEVGKNEGDNYFALRLKFNPSLNLDAVSGQVHHKSSVILHEWNKLKAVLGGKKAVNLNQIWGFFPLLEENPVKPV